MNKQLNKLKKEQRVPQKNQILWDMTLKRLKNNKINNNKII